MISEMEQRVKDGAELLDIERPGWYNEIHPLALTMNNCNECILGQLYGRYQTGLDVLMITWEEGAAVGFDGVPDEDDYLELKEYWVKEIERRLIK